MERTTVRARWRRLLVLLAATSGAAVAWAARKRGDSGWRELSWSDSEPAAAEPAKSDDVAPAEPAASGSAAATTSSGTPAETAKPVKDPKPAKPGNPVAVRPERPAAAEPQTLFDNDGGVEPGPYPNSALPLADGSAPTAEYVIKGNGGSMRSHAPSSPYYGRTRAEVWFRTEEDAAEAGFQPWTRKK